MAGEEEREGGDEGDGDDGDSGVASISRRRLGDGDSADGRRRFREGRSVDSRYRSMVGSGDYNFTMWEEKKQCARSRGSTEIRNQRSRQAGTRTIGAGGLRPTVPQPEPEPMASQAEEIRGRLWPKMATTPVEAQRPLKRTLRADPLGGLVRSVRAQCSTDETTRGRGSEGFLQCSALLFVVPTHNIYTVLCTPYSPSHVIYSYAWPRSLRHPPTSPASSGMVPPRPNPGPPSP